MRNTISRLSPAALAFALWAGVLSGFYLGPFKFEPQPSSATIALLLVFAGTFICFAYAGQRMSGSSSVYRRESQSTVVVREFSCDRMILWLSIVSLAGCALFVVDRIVSSGVSSLGGFTELRIERAQDVAAAAEYSRGLLVYLAYLLYPAVYLVSCLGVICYETLAIRGRTLVLLNLFGPFGLAFVIGGRSPIFVLFLLLVCSCIVRRVLRTPALPRGVGLKLFTAIAVGAFVVYANLVWFERLQVSSTTVDFALSHAANVWGIAPRSSVESVLAEWGRDDVLLPLLGVYFYLFQGPAIFERLMTMDSVPVLAGGYHMDIVAALYRLFEPTRSMLEKGYSQLLEGQVYGFFPGAWGALLIDFSWLAIPFVAAWGWMSGSVFGKVCKGAKLGDALLCVFLLYTILISPISAPLGMANSLSIFLYFLGFKLWITARYRRSEPIVVAMRRYGDGNPRSGTSVPHDPRSMT